MANLETGVSDDYATMKAGKYSFYYGYEMQDDDGNWQFGIKKSGRLILKTTPKLPERLQGADLAEVLLYCVGGFILQQQKESATHAANQYGSQGEQ